MAFSPGFYEASSAMGAPVCASSDGVLGVGGPAVDGERLRVVVGILRSLEGVGLMFCAERPLQVRLPGGGGAEVVVVDVEAGDGGHGLRQVSSGSLVGGDGGAADGAGLVLEPAEPGFLPEAARAVLALDAEGRLGEPESLARLVGEPGLWPLLPAVLRSMDAAGVRRAVPVLAASPCYEQVFPTLRALCQDGMPRSFAPRMLWGQG